jgi:hypothetical protein
MFMALPTAMPMMLCGRWMVQVKARLGFAQRRVRQGAGTGVGFEGAEIMLQARHQRHVAHRFPGRQRIEQVAHQQRVDADVLGLGVLAHPGRDEHVGGRLSAQCFRQGLLQADVVEQVGRHRNQARQVPGRAPRQSIHGPAVGQQFTGGVAAADAACADDQCATLHSSS